jgi:hypothetical protein
MYDTIIMDMFEFICVMTCILVTGGIVFVWMSTKQALIMQDLAEKRRISLERSKAARARYEQPDSADIAPWAGELLNVIGISPEALFENEMPPEVAKLLPLAKGFLQGGGLQKITGALQQQQNNPEERAAI